VSASQGEVNAAVMASTSHNERAVGGIHAAIDELEQARAALMAAAQGSQSPSDFEDAARALSATIEHYRGGIPMATHAAGLATEAAARR
jgi:hypothetical protein